MYIREKHFKNKDGTVRTYLNLVECKKLDGKVVQNNLVNFGRVGQADTVKRLKLAVEALLPFCDDYSVIEPSLDISPDLSLQYGMEVVFKKLWNELSLGKILKQYMEGTKAGYNVTEAIFNMVLNRLISPTSKMKMFDFQDTVYGMEQFEIQNYYRAMDYLIEYKEEIEKAVFERMKEYAGGKVDIALFDTTTVVYYGKDSESESELLHHGFSKAKRSDLKQVVIGVVMSKEGIPLAHEVFPGNKNDVSCCKEIIEKLKTKFSIDRVILVGDRGMISKVNIAELEKNNYEYILGYRMRTIPKEDRKKIFKKADLKKARKTLQYKELEYDGQKLFVCYNPERAELDARHRDKILERIKDKIKNGSILSIIDNGHYKRYLDINGKDPKLSERKIKNDAMYDGVYVLTSNTEMTASKVINAYKDLWQVEHAFRALKSELGAGPMFHYTDNRIRAHIMICFLALILRISFYKKLKACDQELSYSQVISDLKKVQVVKMKIKDYGMHIRTDINENAKAAFKAISMKIPNKVLYDEFNEKQKTVALRRK